MGVKPGRLEKRRERVWWLLKYGATKEFCKSNRYIELKMKQLLKESKEELVEESEVEKSSDDGTRIKTRGIAQVYRGRGVGKEKGKDQIIVFRPNREVKELAGMGQSRVETGGCVKLVLGLCTQ